MNSLKSFAGTFSAFTTKRFGTRASSATGMKSLFTSYGWFFIAYGFTASVPTWPRMSV